MNQEEPLLYFDHCASTPPHPEVIRTLAEVMERHYANPSSIHRLGLDAGRLLGGARELMGRLFGTTSEEWIFTSGGTESNQLAIKGAAYAAKHRGKHVITSATEHPSVREAFESLAADGFEVTYLPVNDVGLISVDMLQEAIRPDTTLVSLMHVNNEVGTIGPIADVGALLRKYPGISFHVDGVQSIGKLPIHLREWGVDLFSGSAHKLRGPKGTGFLYVRGGMRLEPLLGGGGQEGGLRGGTPNVPGIVASVKALRMALESQQEREGRMRALRTRLLRRLQQLPELIINGETDPISDKQAPHILHFSYPGMKPEVIVHALEERGIIISTKSACSSRDERPSEVLLAMGYPIPRAAGGLRVSFGDEHDEAAVDQIAEALEAVVRLLKPLERGITSK
ncbi:cysteine desulfurase [Paenibacillaceae bacterium GAS479]|nr:cysteine desulfurase [Paenibacillaceae bacterium GAS479]